MSTYRVALLAIALLGLAGCVAYEPYPAPNYAPAYAYVPPPTVVVGGWGYGGWHHGWGRWR